MQAVWEIIRNYFSGIYLPKIRVIDVLEIALIAVLIYFFMIWIKRTRAYTLLKGILIVFVFIVIAYIFQMSTILWLISRVGSIALIALVIIFQPELRKVLESIGTRSVVASLFRFDTNQTSGDLFSDRTVNEIVRAVSEMSEAHTGAIIVLEQNILLNEFIESGIRMDSLISSQLLVNIFEHNTPLHDGAAILRGDRIVAATCYLPLSDNPSISKRLGTRHRAGVGISEVSDALTVIVSEETGRISVTYDGALTTGISLSELREKLHRLQKHEIDDRGKKFKIWKGREEDEEETVQ